MIKIHLQLEIIQSKANPIFDSKFLVLKPVYMMLFIHMWVATGFKYVDMEILNFTAGIIETVCMLPWIIFYFVASNVFFYFPWAFY